VLIECCSAIRDSHDFSRPLNVPAILNIVAAEHIRRFPPGDFHDRGFGDTGSAHIAGGDRRKSWKSRFSLTQAFLQAALHAFRKSTDPATRLTEDT